MKLAIIMPTVRAQAGRVAELFLQDVALSGIDLGSVSLYFSIDPPLSANVGAIQLHEEYASRLRLVRYIDERRRAVLAQDVLDHCEVDPAALERLLIRRSYASARNAALLEALNDSNDFALSIDDDVFPVAPKKVGKGQLEWVGVNFMRTHLSRLAAGTDITRGGYLGYASPLVDLPSAVPQACRSALGLALSLGNEILAPDCLSAPPFVRMLTTSGEDDTQLDRESSEKGIVIYGGNVGISLLALREGRIPAFFCPLDARPAMDTMPVRRLAEAESNTRDD
jgi:hypothetical protein